MARICLDPGHAGSNYNAGAVKGYYESAIVWKLTMYEKEFLEKMGHEIVLTRANINDNPSLTVRGQKAKGCDLFVSNHTNACGTPSVTRAVGIYMTDKLGTDVDDKSKELAVKMAQTVDKSMGNIGHQVYSKLSDKDRDGNGLKDDNYYGVLHSAFVTGVPGIIMEHGFHTNVGVCNWLMNDANLRKLAEDCAKCIAAFVGDDIEDAGDLPASNFKSMSREAILEIVGPAFTADQKASGILASVTGAQFILESDGVQSELAQNANNCFGMKASLSGNTWKGSVWDGKIYSKKTSEWDGSKYIEVVADFRAYPDIDHSIADHSAYLLNAMNGKKKRYEGLAGCTDHKKALQIIKDGGYATSPDYVQKLLNVIDKYDLKRFDCPMEETEPATSSTTYPATPFIVQVLIDDLNYRSLPSMKGEVKGCTGKGKFTITEVSNGWGRLKSGVGWIWLGNPTYCTVLDSVKEEPKVPFIVAVDILNLNIRTGPGTGYATTGGTTGIGKFTIVEVKEGKGSDSGWGRLKSGAGWISLDYTTRV